MVGGVPKAVKAPVGVFVAEKVLSRLRQQGINPEIGCLGSKKANFLLPVEEFNRLRQKRGEQGWPFNMLVSCGETPIGTTLTGEGCIVCSFEVTNPRVQICFRFKEKRT